MVRWQEIYEHVEGHRDDSATILDLALMSLRLLSMGIAAMVSSIDISFVFVLALAPPSDSFAAMEKRFAKSARRP